MNVFFAYLDLIDNDHLLELAPSSDLVTEQQGNVVKFGIHGATSKLTLKVVYSIMRCVAQSAVRHNAQLIWSFSSVAVNVAELPALLVRWDETGEPPILSFIALEIGERRHATRGATAFIGYELAAQFVAPFRSRDAARNLVRLARYAMMSDGLAVGSDYEGVDGERLMIDWSCIATSAAMVTVDL